MAAALASVNRRIDTRSNGLKHALLPWLELFAQLETARASRDPYAYARMRESVGKTRVRKARDENLRYLDKHLRYLLLRYGLREAAETANRTARRVIVPESLIRDAIEGKPVKIKWFWELRDSIIERVEDITDATRDAARESVKRIIRESREEKRDDGTPVQPSVGEIARRIRTAFQAPTGVRGAEAERERAHRVHAREDQREFIFSSERAAIIARTELAQSENSGIFNGYAETGVEWVMWHAYGDGRSGDRHHERMNGERIRIGEMFTLPSGVRMRYPADPTAPISETINCRCTLSASDPPKSEHEKPRLAPDASRAEVSTTDQTVSHGGESLRFTRDSTSRNEQRRLVRVPVDAFDEAWAKDGEFYIPPGGGGGEIAGRRAGFANFLRSKKPIEASRVQFDPDTGRVTFTDGRHRFSYLRDLGLKEIPVAVEPSEIEALLRALKSKSPGVARSTPKEQASGVDPRDFKPTERTISAQQWAIESKNTYFTGTNKGVAYEVRMRGEVFLRTYSRADANKYMRGWIAQGLAPEIVKVTITDQ